MPNFDNKAKFPNPTAIFNHLKEGHVNLRKRVIEFTDGPDDETRDRYTAIFGQEDGPAEPRASFHSAFEFLAQETAERVEKRLDAYPKLQLATVKIRSEPVRDADSPTFNVGLARSLKSIIRDAGDGSINSIQPTLVPSLDSPEGFGIAYELSGLLMAEDTRKADSALAKVKKSHSSPIPAEAAFEIEWLKPSRRRIAAAAAGMFWAGDARVGKMNELGAGDWKKGAAARRHYVQLLVRARCPLEALVFGAGFGGPIVKGMLDAAKFDAKQAFKTGRKLIHVDEITPFLWNEAARREDFRFRLPFLKIR
jgi:hypothetical protein